MQQLSQYLPKPSRAGSRAASAAYRQSLQLSEDFTGLEEDTNRYELLQLVKRVGDSAGFTAKMIELLDYYLINFTQDIDWERGSRPIVYQSVSRTALALGVTERQIQRLERRLFEVGACTWHSSGNNKRYGSRDPETGKIKFAFGIDLTPLAYLQTDLQIKLHQRKQYENAWIETRRQISHLRSQIRALLAELREEGTDQLAALETDYQAIAIQLRTHIDLAAMRELLERHTSLHTRLAKLAEPDEPKTIHSAHGANMAEKTNLASPTSDQNVAHYKYWNLAEKNNSSPADPAFQKSVVEPTAPQTQDSEPSSKHLTVERLVKAGSDRLRRYLPVDLGTVGWSEFIDAAELLRAEMFISRQSWIQACQTLGRESAAICVLVTDRGLDRKDNPVRLPAAYFRGMVNKARGGELYLAKSVFGLLELAE